MQTKFLLLSIVLCQLLIYISTSITPVPVEEMYEIIIRDDLSLQNASPQQLTNLIPMNIHGEQYYCSVPLFSQNTQQGTEEKITTVDEKTKKDKTTQNLELLRILSNRFYEQCFYQFSGWWIFEFCFAKQVRQFHQNEQTNNIEQEYFLGFVNKAMQQKQMSRPSQGIQIKGTTTTPSDFATKQELFNFVQELYKEGKITIIRNEQDKSQSVVSWQFSDGTVCDLTKQHRSITVQLQCPIPDDKITQMMRARQLQNQVSMPSLHFVHSVDEPKSCQYVMKFYTDVLCDMEGFEVQQNTIPIVEEQESKYPKIQCILEKPKAKSDEVLSAMELSSPILSSTNKQSDSSTLAQQLLNALTGDASLHPLSSLFDSAEVVELEEEEDSYDENEEETQVEPSVSTSTVEKKQEEEEENTPQKPKQHSI